MELRDARRIGVGRTAEIFAWGEGRVLKLFQAWVPEDWVETEQRGTAAAHRAGVSAPALLGTETVDGRRGLVLERVDGPSLLSVVKERPWRALWAGRLLAEVQAAIHARRVTLAGLPSVRERLRGAIARCGLDPRLRERARAALDGLPDGQSLLHGDLHPDNVILTRRGPVVIDWMAAAVGDPLADVARSSMLIRIGCGPEGAPGPLASCLRHLPHAAYLRQYVRLTGASRKAIGRWGLAVGAGRASERIDVERPALLAWLERLAA